MFLGSVDIRPLSAGSNNGSVNGSTGPGSVKNPSFGSNVSLESNNNNNKTPSKHSSKEQYNMQYKKKILIILLFSRYLI